MRIVAGDRRGHSYLLGTRGGPGAHDAPAGGVTSRRFRNTKHAGRIEMKLYTPTEIAMFVASRPSGGATEGEVVAALREWDRRMNADGASVGREALVDSRAVVSGPAAAGRHDRMPARV